MFYSQLLLSKKKKKGGLGVVWLAAHCHNRLKKDQIQDTNISSSVDKILLDEVHVVTHRILAFLLLGVVRIYSKKVDYLFHDSHQLLDKLHAVRTAKPNAPPTRLSHTHYYSIALPKRFELDAFDLQLLEHQDLVVSGNNISHQQDMLQDGRGKASSSSSGGTPGLCRKGKMPFSSEALTPPGDVFSSHNMYQDMFLGPSSKVSRRVSFSLEDRLDPIVLDEAENEQLKIKSSNEDMATNDMGSNTFGGLSSDSAPSVEILRATAFSLEDRLDPMVLDEVEKEQLNDNRPSNDNTSLKSCELVQDSELISAANRSPQDSDSVASLGVLHKCSFPPQHSPSFRLSDEPTGKEHEVEEEHVQHLRSQLNIQEDDFTESVDIARPMCSKKLNFFEVITPENMKLQRPKEVPMSVLTTDSKLPGLGSPNEVVNVQTPATKERAKILKKKRKILYDSTTMVSNKVLKNWLDDPSGLQREKGNIPHTLFHAWRARKLGHVPGSFFEPFIAVTAVNLGDLECKKINVETIKSVELATSQDDVVKSPAPRQDDSFESPPPPPPPPPPPVVVTHEEVGDIRPHLQLQPQSPELQPQSPIAPGTPVTRLKSSVRSHEAGANADSPTSSYQSEEKSTSSIQWNFGSHEETNSYEGEEYQGKGIYSERTRMMGSYLEKKFLAIKKQQVGEHQALNLSQLLAGKTKRESAQLFYEILVLKTRDLIDVEQENAYHDILLRETKHASSSATNQN